jgi:hypothetical protein
MVNIEREGECPKGLAVYYLLEVMVPQVGFEPTTRCLEDSRSIQLSYWDACNHPEYSVG